MLLCSFLTTQVGAPERAREAPLALKALYDGDTVEEDIILAWHAKADAAKVGVGCVERTVRKLRACVRRTRTNSTHTQLVVTRYQLRMVVTVSRARVQFQRPGVFHAHQRAESHVQLPSRVPRQAGVGVLAL
jgi:hypothetical protein